MSNIPNLPPNKPNRAARRHPNRAVRLPRPLAANLPPPETSQTRPPSPVTGTGADWAGADGSGLGDMAPDRSNDDEATYSVPDQPQRQTRGRGRPRKESRETRIYQFLMQVYGFGGMMVYPINNYDGTVIVNQAESCAKGWIAVGQLHPEVMRVLDLLSRNNAYLLLVGSHVTMAIAIAGNHQWLPSNWAQRLGMPSPPPPPPPPPTQSQSPAAATSPSPGASSGPSMTPPTSASFPMPPVTASQRSERPSPPFAAPGTDSMTGGSGNSTPPLSMNGLSAEQVASIINQAQYELAQQTGQGSSAIPDPRQNPAYLEQLLERRE